MPTAAETWIVAAGGTSRLPGGHCTEMCRPKPVASANPDRKFTGHARIEPWPTRASTSTRAWPGSAIRNVPYPTEASSRIGRLERSRRRSTSTSPAARRTTIGSPEARALTIWTSPTPPSSLASAAISVTAMPTATTAGPMNGRARPA